MSDYIAGELHRLCRDFYANRLAMEEYRYQRGLLLDSLLAGDLEADGMENMPREKVADLQLATDNGERLPDAKSKQDR